ncbi:Outer envelope protein 64, mitochondrial-like protein, partial [Drosera capensis]
FADQGPEVISLGQYIASNVPSLKGYCEMSTNLKSGTETLKALSAVTVLLQRYEFKANHEEWVKSVKPKLGPDASYHVHAAIGTDHQNIKTLYKVRAEMREALQTLLKGDGLLVFPTVADSPLKRNSKRRLSSELFDRAVILSSISSLSGCCQATIPLGKQDDYPSSISFSACHGADKFLLDTILDMYSSLQEQDNVIADSPLSADTNGDLDASELLKEKVNDRVTDELQGNAAFKRREWNKAVSYYSEAIKLNGTNATYYSNRAAAYLELGCFQKAEEDCSKTISLEKKNVKAYLRRGTARESLLRYKEAAEDFKHALVLEPQNKVAGGAEKRLRKLMG